MSKTNEDLVREFLNNGGKIEVLPTVENTVCPVINNLNKKQVTLLTLEEADLMYGKKNEKQVKPKKQDFSSINMELIPDHLKRLILSKQDNDTTKEET